MSLDIASELTSSPSRLRIASLISSRPRTLRELADQSGMSVQGVLRHLARLNSLGLVQEFTIRGEKARKVYSAKRTAVGDFSVRGLTVFKLGLAEAAKASPRGSPGLEYLSEDSILLNTRVKAQVRRLERSIAELLQNQAEIERILSSVKVSDEERLVLKVAFSEGSADEAASVLTTYFGMKDARMSIEKAMSKVRKLV